MNYTKLRKVKSPELTEGVISFFIPYDRKGVDFIATSQSREVPSGLHIEIPEASVLVPINFASQEACIVSTSISEVGELIFHVVSICDELVELKPGKLIFKAVVVASLCTELKEMA